MTPRDYPLLIYHPIFHSDGLPEDSLERSERLEHLIEEVPFIRKSIKELGQESSKMIKAKNGKEFLPLVHSKDYVTSVQEMCQKLQQGEYLENEDVFLGKNSYKMACYAVGASIQAAELAKHGKKSMALVRPPGHHAYPHKMSGFCIFNNIAIATEYLLQQGEKVMIIDVDLHLGDGTLAYVEGKSDVYYFSISQKGLWPHHEPADDTNTELIFLREGTTDREYCHTLEEKLLPAIARFNPDIIAVSAGFDTCGMDLLDYGEIIKGGFALSEKTYSHLWDILDTTLIPYFAVLEGGYNPLSVLSGVLSFLKHEA
ncbi:hypothetical protein HQ489_02360 [Candidatus Woesearchaeota archaeon]|nr:hypothetical protein [Candidatus Woesearchaeota archaeon]